MSNQVSKKRQLVTGMVAATALSAPCFAVDATDALEQRVQAIREALSTQSIHPPPTLLNPSNVVSQFNNNSSWSNWNNCNADNSCQSPG